MSEPKERPDPVAAALALDLMDRLADEYRRAIGRLLRERVREDAEKARR